MFVRNAEMLKTAAINFAEILEEGGDMSPYVYCFDRDLDDGFGVYHSAELWYIFQTLDRQSRRYTGLDYELSKKMTTYWLTSRNVEIPMVRIFQMGTVYKRSSVDYGIGRTSRNERLWSERKDTVSKKILAG